MKRAIKSSLYIRNDPKDLVSKYGPKYLDFGCGYGYGAVKAANDGFNVLAVDIDKNAVFYMITLKKKSQQNWKTVNCLPNSPYLLRLLILK